MPDYRRSYVVGGTFFFTIVTFRRRPILTSEVSRSLLRSAWKQVQVKHPFTVIAVCLLPDHFHCLISFVSKRSGAFEIYITSIATGEKRKLTSIKSDEMLNPIWSRDNKTIYVANSPERQTGSRKIWEVTVEDDTTRKILDFIGPKSQLVYLHQLAGDNESLYFIRSHGVNRINDIWIAQLEYR